MGLVIDAQVRTGPFPNVRTITQSLNPFHHAIADKVGRYIKPLL